MFWGYYNFGSGRRASSGCFFLPFLCICGSLFWFTGGFNSRLLLPLIILGMLALIIPAFLNRGARQVYDREWSGDVIEGQKVKREFDEKPKRDGDYLYREDGEVLEVVDPPRDSVHHDYDEDV